MSSQQTLTVAVVPVRRTAQDQAADEQEFIDNMSSQAYKSWPNEAGFDGLTEERGPLELVVHGDIPTWAAGSLFRTGPGGCKVENTPKGTHYVTHWFDGFAHTHRFDIIANEPASSGSKTRVTYSSRHQAKGHIERIKAKGLGNSFTFGQRRDPCIGLFGKMMSMFQPADPTENICVAVHTNMPNLTKPKHGGKQALSSGGHRNGVWASTDASPFLEMDPVTLEPIGIARQSDLHPSLKGPSSCAHAQRDPETGDMYNFNLDFGGRASTYRVFRVSAATGKTDILATICDPSIKGAYIHSFFMTANYVVLCVPVAHYGLYGLSVPLERNLLDAICAFDKSKPCKWLVIDRRGNEGLVATFDSPAAFFFHSVNSFEEASPDGSGTDIYCDVIDYRDQDVMRGFYYDVLLNREGATATWWSQGDRMRNAVARLSRLRFHLPGAGKKNLARPVHSTAELILAVPSPHVGELPTINPAYQCKRYRYVYSLSNRGRSTLLDTIVKTDVDTQEALLYGCPYGHTPGEPIFVPRPAAEGEVLAEDDGVLLIVVLDGGARRSYLLCLDAKTLQELGRAECPMAVGLGFHGVHAPAGKL
ncbi:beta,beta-carotene 9',10'-dioxygenase [Plectosphaerella plurivora]|uniref:Beta,beta-carotene 9',10'-dioxygenase n=1 Tax=Plectosphaerella plurivora TaxID=936078 RepID=A0A9P8V202_9PEZI|nr:beta,beta-carotene 9',10'-dioxygenase [Plectosphaerella plurivora]